MLLDVTRTLVDHLQSLTADLNDAGASWIAINGLDGDATPTADKLNIFLYAIEEHPHYRNQPLVQRNDEFVRAPLHLRLHYLMAYHSGNHEETQSRLARVIQAMFTKPRLGTEDLRPALLDHVDHLSILLHSPTMDERNQIWSAIGSPMPLALYYQVDVAVIDALETDGSGIINELHVREPA